jgi:hypothetical protein
MLRNVISLWFVRLMWSLCCLAAADGEISCMSILTDFSCDSSIVFQSQRVLHIRCCLWLLKVTDGVIFHFFLVDYQRSLLLWLFLVICSLICSNNCSKKGLVNFPIMVRCFNIFEACWFSNFEKVCLRA